ncbi:hypothetical protein OPT61_g1614 [Boeremia exigua]|uniref:Uncharacterized protein n=1 Tax=Boeremia exigua TaxID=749465 RepID=A0ACC2IPR6_9PLEO|nr:hypothetical protein OPT61_g1614 [Boeremia exigua]
MKSAPHELLVRIIQHKSKWTVRNRRWPAKEDTGSAFNTRAVDHALLNDLEFFQNRFLRLSTRDLGICNEGDENAPQTHRLLNFLEDVVNEALLPPKVIRTRLVIHPKLESLLDHLDCVRGSFDLAGDGPRSLFLIKDSDQAGRALSLISDFDQYLETLFNPYGRAAPMASSKKKPVAPQPDSNEYQHFLHHLLDSLKSGFEYCASTKDQEHRVMIQIPTPSTLEENSQEVDVNTFIRCPRPGTWQGIKYKPEIEHVLAPTRPKQLCEYIQHSLRLEKRLTLYFDPSSRAYRMSEMWQGAASPDPNMYPMRSLEELIGTDSVFHLPFHAPPTVRPWKSAERRELAARLAFSLTLMSSEKHSLQPWNCRDIHFIGLPNSEHDKSTPYLTCTIGKVPASTLDFVDELCPIQAFVEFAKLLLELEYGPFADSGTQAHDYSAVLREYEKQIDYKSSTYLEAVDACLRFHMLYHHERLKPSQLGNPEYTRVKLIHKEIIQKIKVDSPSGRRPPPRGAPSGGRSFIRSKEAVSCVPDREHLNSIRTLNPVQGHSLFEKQTSTNQANDDSKAMRTKDPKASLASITSDLPKTGKQTPPRVPPKTKKAVQWALKALGKTPSMASEDTIMTASTRSHSKTAVAGLVNVNHADIGISRNFITTAASASHHREHRMLDTMKLFSVDSLDSTLRREQKDTKDWIAGFSDLRKTLKTGRARGPPLKIAILDSGIDMGHEDVAEADEDDRIGDYQVFVENSDTQDHCGHGTHIAGIILQLTENAHIYVAKVTDEAEADDKNAALEHARTKWKVDVISLSLGYSTPGAPDEVGAEIERCIDAKIAVFASASNDGGNRPRTYPGNYDRVMCIHSSASTGKASDFNPSPETGKDNFTVVGECVESWWPSSIPRKPNDKRTDTGTKYLSGTSFATPVAIAIAAFMLGYIRKHLSEWKWSIEPKSPAGTKIHHSSSRHPNLPRKTPFPRLSMNGDPEFVILKCQAWMKASIFEDKILGAIIKQPLSPSTNYTPDSPATYLTHDVQDGSATDFLLDAEGGKSHDALASLTSIGNFHVSGNKEDSVHLAGKFVRYKRIQQLDQFWAKLKEDASVKTTVPKWVKRHGAWPVCLVVGIMICEDVEYCIDAKQSSERQAQGEVPIGQIVLASTGVSPGQAVDPKLAVGSSKHTATAFKAKVGESSIFAVELRRITTSWLSASLNLKEDGPKVDGTRLAGTGSDEEEVKDRSIVVNDLILEDLDAETIRDMIEITSPSLDLLGLHIKRTRALCQLLVGRTTSEAAEGLIMLTFVGSIAVPTSPHPATLGSISEAALSSPRHIRAAKLTVVGSEPNILLKQAGGTISQAMRPAFKHRAILQ